MPLSKTIAAQATLKNFLIAGVAYLVSVSVLRRTNWILFGGSRSAFAFNPDVDLNFGYSGEDVITAIGAAGLSFFGRVIALLGTAVNFAQILSFAGVSAILINEGVKVAGDAAKAFTSANQVPLASAALHVVETVIILLAINSHSASLASLGGLISYVRGLTAVANFLALLVALPFLVQSWSKSIGRDGRQKIEKKN
ncbi:hypothetical protein HDU67_005105 [Dinochytrium kinnereticum]|nr:hypothetical protein HDU67_005105 [Dinochytrium kinnereticum]